MKTYEFNKELNDKGEILIPEQIKVKLKTENKTRVILLLEDEEEVAWQKLTRDSFFEGYSEKDSAYNDLDRSAAVHRRLVAGNPDPPINPDLSG
jgi:bifunctional DNA-binding transcriptional regulator/antitoxin component of YhaV-PrlF toxin-antitoxin module